MKNMQKGTRRPVNRGADKAGNIRRGSIQSSVGLSSPYSSSFSHQLESGEQHRPIVEPAVSFPVIAKDTESGFSGLAVGDATNPLQGSGLERRGVKIAYFIHDLTDPSVARRIEMLRRGGAKVIPIGFRRSIRPVKDIAGIPALDLGQTADGKLLSRAALVFWRRIDRSRLRQLVTDADIVLARNIEMLTIAEPVRREAAPRATLVYECLDIHSKMLSDSRAGAILQAWERRLLSACDTLVVSSAAFIREYFAGRQTSQVPALLAENKRLLPEGSIQRPSMLRSPGPPWRIGWFGLIRCRRSLDILKRAVMANPGLLQVIIRGRSATNVFSDLAAEIADCPGIEFGGPYSPDELPAMYADCHFSWAIDFSQEGENSNWLLPNRIYEGGYFNVPALAQADVETGRWLADREAGVLLKVPDIDFVPFLQGLTAARYTELSQAAAALPTADLVWGEAEIATFVAGLAQRRSSAAVKI